MSWLARNAESIEAVSAAITAVVAVAALIGVKVQLDETDRIQKAQSAREAYRAHLALAATLPQFEGPQDACALLASEQGGAYSAFVDHLLYSAEQMLVVSDGWEETFLAHLQDHRPYICSADGPTGDSDETAHLLALFRQSHCSNASACE